MNFFSTVSAKSPSPVCSTTNFPPKMKMSANNISDAVLVVARLCSSILGAFSGRGFVQPDVKNPFKIQLNYLLYPQP